MCNVVLNLRAARACVCTEGEGGEGADAVKHTNISSRMEGNVLVLLLVYCACSSLMLILNKLTVSHIAAPAFVTATQARSLRARVHAVRWPQRCRRVHCVHALVPCTWRASASSRSL